jgi:hypothetical protein
MINYNFIVHSVCFVFEIDNHVQICSIKFQWIAKSDYETGRVNGPLEHALRLIEVLHFSLLLPIRKLVQF